jgi:hypothetical protein
LAGLARRSQGCRTQQNGKNHDSTALLFNQHNRIVGQMWQRLEPYVVDGRLDAEQEDQASESEGAQYVEARAGRLEAAGTIGGELRR